MNLYFGYCCVSMLHKKLKCSRASTKTYLEKRTVDVCHDYLLEKARMNLADLKQLLRLNYEEGIFAFRLPDQLLPQLDLGYYQLEELRDELRDVGRVANDLNLQLSMHPSQFFVLNSLKIEVVNRTIHTLDLVANIFDHMELQKTPNLTLHLGMKNGYETVDDALISFCNNFGRLSNSCKRYLVLENDHVSFTIDQCLKVHNEIGIPIVFDNKHYEWNPGILTYDEALTTAVQTWKDRTPKLHLSSDKDQKKHAHANQVRYEDFAIMRSSLLQAGINECYIMLECKDKDMAVIQLMNERKSRESM